MSFISHVSRSVGVVLGLLLIGPNISAAQMAGNDPRDAMIQVLASTNPNPSLGTEARTFDRLVGTWDCEFTFHLDDGSVRHKSGQVLFGWVLDGQAIQDIWITWPPQDSTNRSMGTSFRFFDTKLKQWRVLFVSPGANYVVSVQGGREGDHIVLRGTDVDGLPIRWSFMDITPDSFTWHGEKSHDGGKTWKLEEEHHMRRLGVPSR